MYCRSNHKNCVAKPWGMQRSNQMYENLREIHLIRFCFDLHRKGYIFNETTITQTIRLIFVGNKNTKRWSFSDPNLNLFFKETIDCNLIVFGDFYFDKLPQFSSMNISSNNNKRYSVRLLEANFKYVKLKFYYIERFSKYIYNAVPVFRNIVGNN